MERHTVTRMSSWIGTVVSVVPWSGLPSKAKFVRSVVNRFNLKTSIFCIRGGLISRRIISSRLWIPGVSSKLREPPQELIQPRFCRNTECSNIRNGVWMVTSYEMGQSASKMLSYSIGFNDYPKSMELTSRVLLQLPMAVGNEERMCIHIRRYSLDFL